MEDLRRQLRLIEKLPLPAQVKQMARAEMAGHSAEYQYFTFAPGPGCLWQWNVSLAEAIVAGRAPTGEFPVEKVRRMAEHSGARFHQEKIDSDEVDLTIPIICVGMRIQDAHGNALYDGPFPVDGWHRLLKAIQRGVATVPYHMLSDEENMLCRYRENETTYEEWVTEHGVPLVLGE